jgi:uncharacterized protein (DUF2126 family)
MNAPAGAPALDRAVQAHDDALHRAGLAVWIGSEPTFTDRFSEHPAWLSAALGGDKEARGQQLLAGLARVRPGGAVLRSVGRQYGGEPLPRWCIGLYERRDGAPLWLGPPDPLLCGAAAGCEALQLDQLWHALAAALRQAGRCCEGFLAGDDSGHRLAFRLDGAPPGDIQQLPAIHRGPLHARSIAPSGLSDELAEQGLLLLTLRREATAAEGPAFACVELPALPDVRSFVDCLASLAAAAAAVGLPALMLRGFPPPVDSSVAWSTVTPDPAVVEVNHAPATDAATFLRWSRQIHAAAEVVGLSPYRLHYNGQVAESGGAGHFTLGGPSALDSPFFRVPRLLPRLVRYLNHHPSLSYWFAAPHLGGSGQSPRPDEGSRESFAELDLALELLERRPAGEPAALARALAPFMVDPAGNPHRSELNIEKLWNPALGARGCLGLVELRAFRMARTPARAAACACLLRALVAMLSRSDPAPRLRHWGEALHDRFALPFHLRQDLRAVLADLDAAGFGLAPVLRAELFDDRARPVAEARYAGALIEIEQALEFWPLVGDVASQEIGDSRLVDASTARLQVTVRLDDADAAARLRGWRLSAEGWDVPLQLTRDEHGPLAVAGVRFRRFVPQRGLHPSLGALDRVRLVVTPADGNRALELTVHEWRPDGEAYDGLPTDLADARARRQQRIATREIAATPATVPAEGAVNPYCLDLRRV